MAGLPEILESFEALNRLRLDKPHTCDTVVGFRNVLGEYDGDGAAITTPIEFSVHSTVLMCAPYLLKLLTEAWSEGTERRIFFDVATMSTHQLIRRTHVEQVLGLLYRDKFVVDSLRATDAIVIAEPNGAKAEEHYARMLILLEFSWVFGFSLLTEMATKELLSLANTSLFNFVDALCAPHLARGREQLAAGGGRGVSPPTAKEQAMLGNLSSVHTAALKRTASLVVQYWEADGGPTPPPSDLMPIYHLNLSAFLSILPMLAQNVPYTKLLRYAFYSVSSSVEQHAVLCNLDAVLEEIFFEYLLHLATLDGETRAVAAELAELIDYAQWQHYAGGTLLSMHYAQRTPMQPSTEQYRPRRTGVRLALVVYRAKQPPPLSSCLLTLSHPHVRSQKCDLHSHPMICAFRQSADRTEIDITVAQSIASAWPGGVNSVLEWTSMVYREQQNPHLVNFNINKQEPGLVHGSVTLQQSSENVLYFGVAGASLLAQQK